MASVTQLWPSSTHHATGVNATAEFVNPLNVSVNDSSTFATAAISSSSVDLGGKYGFFGFDALIPSGSTIDKVQLRYQGKLASGLGLGAQGHIRAVISGSAQTDHTFIENNGLTLHTVDVTADRAWTRADLLDGTFECNLEEHGFGSGAANTADVNDLTVIVDYTVPAAPPVTTGGRRRRRLGHRRSWPTARTLALLLSSVKPFVPSLTRRRATLRRPILRRHRWPQTRTVRLLLSSVKPFTPIATRAKLRRPIRRRLRPRPIQSAAILLATVKPIGTPGTSDTPRPKLRRPMRRRRRPVQVTTPQLLLASVQPFTPEPARPKLRRPIRRRLRPVQLRTVAGLISTTIPFIPRSTRLKLRRPIRRRTRTRAAYSLVNLTAVKPPLPFPARSRLRRPMRRRQRPIQTRTPSLLLAGVKPIVPLLRRRRPVWLGRRRPHPQGVALALYYAIPPKPFAGVPNKHRSRSLGPHRKIRQTPAAALRMTPQAAPFHPAGVAARAKLRRPLVHRRARVQGVSRAVRATVAPPFRPPPRVRRARQIRHNRAHPARQNLALYLTPPGQQPTLPLLGVGL